MKCAKCGNELREGDTFCSKCGTKIGSNNNVNETGFSKNQKIIIISLLSLLLVILLITVLVIPGGNKTLKNKKKDPTRTIMMYMVGSDLESENGIATADLNGINPSEIDLEKTNVILYTGGTKKWQNNFISNEENAIFKLTKNGFEKIETYKKLNMGDPNTLTSFINYVYQNYKTGHYNLLLYDHGGALSGALFDDFTDDALSLEDFKKAMQDSPFNENNKLDSIIFRTCLNGSLEVASIFSPYADYITFSEEVSWGSNYTNVLGFINEVTPAENGADVGKKFLSSYLKQMNDLDFFDTTPRTYSVVDLSKVDKVIEELNRFFSQVGSKTNYNDVSRLRSGLYQYGLDTNSFDMVDLKSLVTGISGISGINADVLLKAIDDALVYNDTNLDGSNGLSIYFPYKGSKMTQSSFLKLYEGLSKFGGYNQFIKGFNNTQRGSSPFSFNTKDLETSTVDNGKEVSITLTDDEKNNYSSTVYAVFEKDQEHPRYYKLLYSSNDVKMAGNKITTNISNNLVRVYDEDDKKNYYIPVTYRKYGKDETRKSTAIAYSNKKEITDNKYRITSDVYYTFKEDKPTIATAKVTNSSDERILGALLDLKEYDKVEIFLSEWRLLDDEGNLLDNSKWEAPPTISLYSTKIGEDDFERASLEDGEYYVVFFVYDVNDEVHTSRLIKVGE